MPDPAPTTRFALDNMLIAQQELQTETYGINYDNFMGEQRANYIRDMVLACCHELHEALDEVGWKPWATSRHLHREAFLGELIDAFHFFMNLWLAGGGTVEEWQEMYFVKWQINRRRQDGEYTGVKDA